MGRKSKIDTHPRSEEIVKLLASGEEYSNIVQDFPTITWYDLDYYAKEKLHKILSKSVELKEAIRTHKELEVSKADTLLEGIISLREKAERILEQAEMAGELKTALLGIREARSCLELLAKVEGQIREQQININQAQNTQINYIQSPQWTELRNKIVLALDPFPEAKAAVVHAIHGA